MVEEDLKLLICGIQTALTASQHDEFWGYFSKIILNIEYRGSCTVRVAPQASVAYQCW